MADPALRTEGLIKQFGGLTATDNLDLEVAHNELHAIIGPNGAGKTTLVSQLSGELRPDDGRIYFNGEDITRVRGYRRPMLGLARSFQITSIFLNFTTLDNVALAVQAHEGHSFRFWAKASKNRTIMDKAREGLERVGLGDRADVLSANLAHGEQRQLELAMALASDPALLLLDEPMAGMGPEESAKLVQLLRELKNELTIVLVEHDMDAVFALADRITVLVYGRAIATGTPEEIRANTEVQQAYLGEDTTPVSEP